MRTRLTAWWRDLIHQTGTDFADLPPRHLPAVIVLLSALALYLEMAIIRYHASATHAFTIFKNISLLSCFLGLGLGFALAARGRRISLAPVLPLLAVQVILLVLVSQTRLGGRIINPAPEQLTMGRADHAWSWYHAVEGTLFLAIIFVLNALQFVPLGGLTGSAMSRLPALRSYGLNLLGSLLGIGVFFLLSLAWTGPEIWLGLGIVGVALLLPAHSGLVRLAAVSIAVILIGLGLTTRPDEYRYYSPYQLISLRLARPDSDEPPLLRINHTFYQDVCDCSAQGVARSAHLAAAAEYYNLPYRLRPRPGKVLVVGAGTGNDVAAALRHGASEVTAVDIDPTILYLGKKVHPEQPYNDHRVRTVVNDARTYLRQGQQRYDTIVYGLLDSHTNLGALSNIRLDSFVYTQEGFREAAARLSDDGVLIVTYLTMSPLQGARLYAMLQQACPEQPVRVFTGVRGSTYVAGPGALGLPVQLPGTVERSREIAQAARGVEVPTDDWPQFYLQERRYPLGYAALVGVLLLLSLGVARWTLGEMPRPSAGSGVFFFLGAGFMLIETRVITELGLFFGNTWLVVALAIAGVLLMGYLANAWIARLGALPEWQTFLLLGLSLCLSPLLGGPAGLPSGLGQYLAPLLLTLPIFFAGWIFSGQLAQSSDIGQALSANLFGALVGGFLEYHSMYWGLTSLYWLGLGLYGAAFVCVLLQKLTVYQQGVATTPMMPARQAA